MSEVTSLGEALPLEIERCQEMLAQYVAIGPSGLFGAMMIRPALSKAIKALAEGDVVQMIRSYEELKTFED